MSNKRVAGRELNHDNWNEEEDDEDVGEFKKASNDILSKRVRKVAKRRAGVSGEGSQQVLNPFSGFGGFGSGSNAAMSTPLSASSTPFSFLAKLPSTPATALTATAAAAVTATSTTKTNGESKASDSSTKHSEYNAKVRALNIAFIDWIKKHVDENSLCDLKPVFTDYEKYMKEFSELKRKLASTPEKKKEESKGVFAITSPSAASFSFGKPASTSASSSVATNIFSSVNTSSIFSSTAAAAATNTTAVSSPTKPPAVATESKGFSFGLAAASQPAAAPAFSFGLQKNAPIFGGSSSISNMPSAAASTFSFANVTQTKTSTEGEQGGGGGGGGEGAEADEEPPKNEFVPVVEEDSLFSKRCKVFVKTGADYTDRGVGTLYLKRVDGKVQLIVRADTNLGNILLNIILQEGLPTSRLGKNNVMIVCLPTPDSKPPPTPVLVRVKTGDEADELLSILEKYKSED